VLSAQGRDLDSTFVVTRGTWRRLGVLLVLPALLAVLLSVTAGVAPASAHAALASTTPAQGSELAALPGAVTLLFTEEVALNPRSVQVTDARGKRVDDGRPQHVAGDSRSVRVGLLPGSGKGSYTVTWRVVSVDGHPVSGTFAFGVGVPAGTVEQTAPVDPVVGALRTATQLLSYLGAALLVGGSAFLFLLWPDGHGSPRMRQLLIWGVAIAAVGSIGALLVQGPYVAGRALDGLADTSLLRETAASSYGRPLLLRVLAVALAVPVLGVWPRLPEGEDAGPGGIAAVGNVVLLAASFSLTGHAAEASPRLLAELSDGVHLASAGVWLGGLAVLLLAYLPSALSAGSDPASLLPRWSRVAMTAVGLLVVTGTYQAWRETRALDALTGTTYGKLLLTKIAIVAALLATALAARRLVARVAQGTSDLAPTVRRLRSAVSVEACLGVGVLLVTSYLVATPPARTSFGPPFSASVTGKDAEGTPIRVVLDVAPTRVGPQTVRLHTYAPDGQVLPFESASLELRREGGAGPVRQQFAPIADGEAVAANVVVPEAGRWTMTVQVLTDATTDYAATAAYTVR
jgi:copper transport protein